MVVVGVVVVEVEVEVMGRNGSGRSSCPWHDAVMTVDCGIYTHLKSPVPRQYP